MECLRRMLNRGLKDDDLPIGPGEFNNAAYAGDFKRFLKHQRIKNFAPLPHPLPTFIQGTFRNVPPLNDPLPLQSGVRLGKGVSAKVYELRIDAMCTRDFALPLAAPVGDTTLSRKFGMKEFFPTEAAHMNNEQNFALFLHLAPIAHDHITKTYTDFEYNGKTYLITELAKMNLRDRFSDRADRVRKLPRSEERRPPGGKVERFTLFDHTWLRDQMVGLAGALRAIHGPTATGRIGYHHDIKTTNILFFGKDENYRLKLTDWGCAGFHDNYNAQAGSAATSRQGDSYFPPEYMNAQPTSRPHDVWSLGCVFVELLVWYHYGWGWTKPKIDPKGLWQFKEDVKNEDNLNLLCWFVEGPPDSDPDSAYEYVGPNGHPVVLAKSVDAKLAQLAAKSTKMAQVVGVLRQMLTIQPKERVDSSGARIPGRITADDAYQALAAIPHPW